jgi:hypothetical protein
VIVFVIVDPKVNEFNSPESPTSASLDSSPNRRLCQGKNDVGVFGQKPCSWGVSVASLSKDKGKRIKDEG